jgi:hypothetical protein
MPVASSLPGFDFWLDQVVASEQGDGWLLACEGAGRFLAPCRELVQSLAALLRCLTNGRPILEVCSGGGELAAALRAAGVPILATDASPAEGTDVERIAAQEALQKYRPGVVLGAFVPSDAGVEPSILNCPSVEHYVVLGARINGAFGASALWQDARWQGSPLGEMTDWMITRHDVWLGRDRLPLLRHGEAWHFQRNPVPDP